MDHYETIEFITKQITDVLSAMGVNGNVSYEESIGRGLVFNIITPESRLLIGQHGNNLYALEHLIHSVVGKGLAGSEFTRFSIDINEYKKRRESSLKQLVKDVLRDIRTGETKITLPVMNKYERRFVHAYIQEQFPHVTTESVGDEPQRRIQISI